MENYIKYSLEKEINNVKVLKDEKNNLDIPSIIFGQLIPLSYNMTEFGLNKNEINELINLFVDEYKLNDEKKIWF